MPQFLKRPDITAIYKGSGEKMDLNNERGVFTLPVIRTILDKLIYFDNQKVVDDNMSESNIGARRDRNIRDHLFVVNGVLNSVKNNEIENIDVQLMDIAKCFDAQWPTKTMNDFYEVAEKNDKLVIMNEANKDVEIAIKTAFGKTDRENIGEIEMQGSVMGPIKAAVQIDTVGKECIQNRENLLQYKKTVDIPPLSFIDDILAFSKCGQNSIKLNCFLNAKIQSKRLWFSETKCHQIHIGQDARFCPSLKVHDKEMKKVDDDKYLGDIISSDGSNQKDIDKKLSKGMGIISQVMSLLSEISLGSHYFDIALLLRETLFVNGFLTNLEVKYGLREKDLDDLENIDKILLRKILNAHSKTPIESLYLETGTLPLKTVLKSRRIMYLHHILRRKEGSLLLNFFRAQSEYPANNDWSETVKKDLKDFDISTLYI